MKNLFILVLVIFISGCATPAKVKISDRTGKPLAISKVWILQNPDSGFLDMNSQSMTAEYGQSAMDSVFLRYGRSGYSWQHIHSLVIGDHVGYKLLGKGERVRSYCDKYLGCGVSEWGYIKIPIDIFKEMSEENTIIEVHGYNGRSRALVHATDVREFIDFVKQQFPGKNFFEPENKK